jgi:hypothetical protein
MQNFQSTPLYPQYPTGASAVSINIFGAQVPGVAPVPEQQLQGPNADTFERASQAAGTQQA